MNIARLIKNLSISVLFLALVHLFGTVGGLEHGTMPYAEGVVRCIVYVALMAISSISIKLFGGN